jgi:hypothetical protein
VILRAGWVIVVSLPTSDGTAATSQAGCLLVLDNTGNVVETIADTLINGLWDMTVLDNDVTAELFLTNGLNGTVAAGGAIVDQGTVIGINLVGSPHARPSVKSMTIIGSGFAERTDPVALVIGPTGVGLGAEGTFLCRRQSPQPDPSDPGCRPADFLGRTPEPPSPMPRI